ncbi:unnamed protein product, partial [Vitis vinifera]|uniref:Uncharacterized protein n=1 Tax=Vitis vinifera TaxID=29760 RepID=D7TRC3_VITVI
MEPWLQVFHHLCLACWQPGFHIKTHMVTDRLCSLILDMGRCNCNSSLLLFRSLVNFIEGNYLCFSFLCQHPCNSSSQRSLPMKTHKLFYIEGWRGFTPVVNSDYQASVIYYLESVGSIFCSHIHYPRIFSFRAAANDPMFAKISITFLFFLFLCFGDWRITLIAASETAFTFCSVIMGTVPR